MTDDALELGTIKRARGCFEARLERFLEHDQKTVWAMLTDPAKLPEWLAPGELSSKQGGPAKLNFPESGTIIDSRVSAIEAPRLIEYSWSGPGEPERPVRWETTARRRRHAPYADAAHSRDRRHRPIVRGLGSAPADAAGGDRRGTDQVSVRPLQSDAGIVQGARRAVARRSARWTLTRARRRFAGGEAREMARDVPRITT